MSVAVDAAGNVYVAGRTTSSNLVPSSQATEVPQSSRSGSRDGFVVKMSPDGVLAWASYLGGRLDDWVNGVAADPLGNLAVAGETKSTDFPTRNAFQSTRSRAGLVAVFAARLAACKE